MRLNGDPECLEIKPGKAHQECDNGFTRNSTGVCIDLDECQMIAKPCGSNEVCRNTPGSYTCECGDGYVLGDDKTCLISNTLVIWASRRTISKAGVTDINGLTSDVQWGQQGEVSASSHCSLTFENQFYLLG